MRDSSAGAGTSEQEDDFDPFDEARMLSAVVGGIRFVALYAPNGRVVGSPFYEGKLHWFERVRRWLDETRSAEEPLVLAGDYNVTPADEDVWDPVKAHGGTHVSEPERDALARLRAWGLADAYRLQEQRGGRFSWWDYRAGMFHRNEGMRIDLLYVTEPVAKRVVWAEIDREARKGPPVPSDHAPVVVDLDTPGKPFKAGWDEALARIQARTRPSGHKSPGAGPVRGGAEDPVRVAAARLGARASAATRLLHHMLRLTAEAAFMPTLGAARNTACSRWPTKRRSFVGRNTSSTNAVSGGRNDADFRATRALEVASGAFPRPLRIPRRSAHRLGWRT